jgi:hypothetical protein
LSIAIRRMGASLTFIPLTRTESRNHRAHTMNIPDSKKPDAAKREPRQLWIGITEVRPSSAKPNETIGHAKGAFVNIVTWASDAPEFKRNAELILDALGLIVVDVQNPEPVVVRRSKAEFDEAIKDMIDRAKSNPNAIIYGTFHTYKNDDA